MFVLLPEAVAKSSAPDSVKWDSVLLQYLIDTRVDQVWRDYITDLGNTSNILSIYKKASLHCFWF